MNKFMGWGAYSFDLVPTNEFPDVSGQAVGYGRVSVTIYPTNEFVGYWMGLD